jgi:hypothetical protein
MASSNAAVTPFPPPPRFYEEFEPHGSKDFQCPAPPPPLEGPYVVYGVRYDTSFSPQDPAAAHRDRGLDIEVEQQSPVATLRLLNRVLPEEYLKLMQVRPPPPPAPPPAAPPPQPPPPSDLRARPRHQQTRPRQRDLLGLLARAYPHRGACGELCPRSHAHDAIH